MTRWYNPEAFRVDDAGQLGGLIRNTVFGTLLSNGDAGPLASHVPFLFDRAAGTLGTLRVHLARANEHWEALEDQPVLAIFHGPHHYVTPSWYASKADHGKVVPTWNYVVVHARGRARVHHDRDRLRALVEALTNQMESARSAPWRVDAAPADYVERMVDQIVGVDVEIERLEGKFKLGQNRPAADRATLAQGLEREQPDVWRVLEALLR